MDGNRKTFDPIRLEVIRTRMSSTVDEAAKVIVRTSFSMLLNEANDEKRRWTYLLAAPEFQLK